MTDPGPTSHDYKTNGTAWRLLRRLTKVADHGGPSNWRTFITADDEKALVADLDAAGYLGLDFDR